VLLVAHTRIVNNASILKPFPLLTLRTQRGLD